MSKFQSTFYLAIYVAQVIVVLVSRTKAGRIVFVRILKLYAYECRLTGPK